MNTLEGKVRGNRMERRAACLILKENEHFDILNLCQSVKNGLDGSAEDWSNDDVLRIHGFLITCLNTWEPSTFKPTEAYDKCVYQLIIETIKLIGFFLKERVFYEKQRAAKFTPTI